MIVAVAAVVDEWATTDDAIQFRSNLINYSDTSSHFKYNKVDRILFK